MPDRFKGLKRALLAISCMGLIVLVFAVASINHQRQKSIRTQVLKDFSNRADHLAALMSYVIFERNQDGEDIASSRELTSYFQGRDLGMSSQYGLMAAQENIHDLLKRKLHNTTYQDSPVYSRIAVILDGGRPLAVAPSTINTPLDWSRYRYTLDERGRMTTEWEEGSPRLVISRPFFYKGRYEAQIVLWILPSDLMARIRTSQQDLPWDRVFMTTKNGQKVVSPFQDSRWTSWLFQAMEGSQGPEILSYKDGKKRLLVAKSDIPNTPLYLYLVAPEEKVLNDVKVDATTILIALLSMILVTTWICLGQVRLESQEVLMKLTQAEKIKAVLLKRISLYIGRISSYRDKVSGLTEKIDILSISQGSKEYPAIKDKKIKVSTVRRKHRRAANPQGKISPAPFPWAILDREKFSKLTEMAGNHIDLLEGIIRDFLNALPAMQKDLKQAIEEVNMAKIGEASSRLGEALYSLGSPFMADICRSIAIKSLSGRIDEIRSLNIDLTSGLEDLVSTLLAGEWRR